MKMKKEIKDVDDVNQAFDQLSQKLERLNARFLALGMDYQHYIDNSLIQKEIYDLRDNVTYRFFSAQFHVEVLLRHHIQVERRLSGIFQKDPSKITNRVYPSNPIFDCAEREISSLFDSIVYHLVSIFDYLGTLTNYICGQQKIQYIKWTQLTNSARDSNNSLSKKTIADLILQLDRELVDKLYEHRSYLIHKKADIARSRISLHISQKGEKFTADFFSTDKLNKSFAFLRDLQKTHDISMKFVSIWIVEEVISATTEILFALKQEMEANRKVAHGAFVIAGKKGEILPVSTGFWSEKEYLESKKKTTHNRVGGGEP